MTPIIFIGLGLGVLVLVADGPKGRDCAAALRERTLEAQRESARASQRARDLAAQWSTMERRS